jgi:quinol monooxygenase YgiN
LLVSNQHDRRDESIVALIVRFRVRDGRRAEFVGRLRSLLATMSREPSSLGAQLLESVDDPNELVVYETWAGTRETWLRDEAPRPYRKPYEDDLATFVDSRTAEWLIPVAGA